MCNLHWCYTFSTGVTLFALVLHLNCTALSQSESRNFFMCIINYITRHDIYQTRGRVKHWEVCWKNEGQPSFFNKLRSVWISDETLFRLFDIASQSIDNSWRKSKRNFSQTSKTHISDPLGVWNTLTPKKLRPTRCIENSDPIILLIRDKKLAHEAISECATVVPTTFCDLPLNRTDSQQHAIYLFYIRKRQSYQMLQVERVLCPSRFWQTWKNNHSMYQSILKPPIPHPFPFGANPGAFDFFEKFWLHFTSTTMLPV